MKTKKRKLDEVGDALWDAIAAGARANVDGWDAIESKLQSLTLTEKLRRISDTDLVKPKPRRALDGKWFGSQGTVPAHWCAAILNRALPQLLPYLDRQRAIPICLVAGGPATDFSFFAGKETIVASEACFSYNQSVWDLDEARDRDIQDRRIKDTTRWASVCIDGDPSIEILDSVKPEDVMLADCLAQHKTFWPKQGTDVFGVYSLQTRKPRQSFWRQAKPVEVWHGAKPWRVAEGGTCAIYMLVDEPLSAKEKDECIATLAGKCDGWGMRAHTCPAIGGWSISLPDVLTTHEGHEKLLPATSLALGVAEALQTRLSIQSPKPTPAKPSPTFPLPDLSCIDENLKLFEADESRRIWKEVFLPLWPKREAIRKAILELWRDDKTVAELDNDWFPGKLQCHWSFMKRWHPTSLAAKLPSPQDSEKHLRFFSVKDGPCWPRIENGTWTDGKVLCTTWELHRKQWRTLEEWKEELQFYAKELEKYAS